MTHDVDSGQVDASGEGRDPVDDVEVPLRIVVPAERCEKAEGHSGLRLDRGELSMDRGEHACLDDAPERELRVGDAHRAIVFRDLPTERKEEERSLRDRAAKAIDPLHLEERHASIERHVEPGGEPLLERRRELRERDELALGVDPRLGEECARVRNPVLHAESHEIHPAHASGEVGVEVGHRRPADLPARAQRNVVKAAVVGGVAELEGGELVARCIAPDDDLSRWAAREGGDLQRSRPGRAFGLDRDRELAARDRHVAIRRAEPMRRARGAKPELPCERVVGARPAVARGVSQGEVHPAVRVAHVDRVDAREVERDTHDLGV